MKVNLPVTKNEAGLKNANSTGLIQPDGHEHILLGIDTTSNAPLQKNARIETVSIHKMNSQITETNLNNKPLNNKSKTLRYKFKLTLDYRWSDLVWLAGLALAYAMLAKVALSLFAANGVVSIVWPPSGLALAALLIGGKKYWPGVFLGALAGNLMMGSPAVISVFIASGNTLEAITGVWLLSRYSRFDSRLTQLRDFLWLGSTGAVSACVSALIGVSTLLFMGAIAQQAALSNLIHWWQGDALGIFLGTPLLLVWRQIPQDWLSRRRITETVACFGLALFVGQIVFLGWFQNIIGNSAKGYWIFLFIAWAAIRFGRHGVLLIISIASVQALLGAIHHIGAFSSDFVQSGLLNFWLYTLALTVAGITLAVAIDERKMAEGRVQRQIKLYKALSEVNQAIVRMEQQVELFPLVCRCAVEFGGIKMAWVGQLDELSGMIVPTASHGEGRDYLDNIYISSHIDIPEGRGPTGTALRENQAIIINDYLNNRITAPWQEKAVSFGWNSAASFPIQRGSRPFAVLSVYHSEINAFDTEAISLLEEMSKNISFALDNFDRETQRRIAEDSLRLAASVYESSSEAMIVTDADSLILTVNPAFTEVTGYLPEEVIGKNPSILSSGRHDKEFYQAMWKDIHTTGHWHGEIWDKRKDGKVYAIRLSINTIFNEDGTVHRRISLFSDATEWKETEELIWRQANFDLLTELPNRQMFQDRLNNDIKKANRTALPLALMFIDLDRFKEVNDTLGHDKGDILLKEASHRLSSCVRETDTVARLGGDEFTIILGELHELDIIELIAQNILCKLAEPFHMGNEVAYVTASIGITLYPDDAADIETLLKNADQAMYAAKQLGRNRYHYFTAAMQESALGRMRLANELRGALPGNQFRLVYQPIVELATNAIHKAEALIRWQHPQRGLVSPAEFIPIAEDIGLIIDIGEWVFREAVQQASLWRASHHPEFQISINKSPVQFKNESSAYATWPDQLQQLGLPGQSIVVEITEGVLMDASDTINNKLLAFRDAGIQVSLDDFGTGYSSLSYLKKFDIDYLKIDQSFTRNLAPGSDDMALCEAIIMMAHKLDMKVIAEGVETAEQCQLLLVVGCDYGQGYFFSRPLPANEFEELLQKL